MCFCSILLVHPPLDNKNNTISENVSDIEDMKDKNAQAHMEIQAIILERNRRVNLNKVNKSCHTSNETYNTTRDCKYLHSHNNLEVVIKTNQKIIRRSTIQGCSNKSTYATVI